MGFSQQAGPLETRGAGGPREGGQSTEPQPGFGDRQGTLDENGAGITAVGNRRWDAAGRGAPPKFRYA